MKLNDTEQKFWKSTWIPFSPTCFVLRNGSKASQIKLPNRNNIKKAKHITRESRLIEKECNSLAYFAILIMLKRYWKLWTKCNKPSPTKNFESSTYERTIWIRPQSKVKAEQNNKIIYGPYKIITKILLHNRLLNFTLPLVNTYSSTSFWV